MEGPDLLMMQATYDIVVLPNGFSICRLDAGQAVPAWAFQSGISHVSVTEEEVSILCRTENVPPDVQSEAGWRALMLIGPFAFDQTGVLASVLNPLATEEIGILAISTFDTDYVMVKEESLEESIAVLRQAGHRLTLRS